MSHVDNMFVFANVGALDINQVNAVVEPNQKGQGFRSLDDCAGGYKVLELDSWAIAFNYGQLPDVFTAIHDAVTDEVVFVQVLLFRENDSGPGTLFTWDPAGWGVVSRVDLLSKSAIEVLDPAGFARQTEKEV